MTGELSEANRALVEGEIGLPWVTTVYGGLKLTDWGRLNRLLDAARAEGRTEPRQEGEGLTLTCYECGHDLNGPYCPACNPEIAGPPPGWRLVPVEPTREMWAAMADAVANNRNMHHDVVTAQVWTAALAAAPLPQGEDRPSDPDIAGLVDEAAFAQSVLRPLSFRMHCRKGAGENVAIGQPLCCELEAALATAADIITRLAAEPNNPDTGGGG